MSITLEEAYSSAQSLIRDREVYLCFENDEDWVFFYQNANAKPIPGDFTNPSVVNKKNGNVKGLFGTSEWDGFKDLLKHPLTERGYKSVDIEALVHTEHTRRYLGVDVETNRRVA